MRRTGTGWCAACGASVMICHARARFAKPAARATVGPACRARKTIWRHGRKVLTDLADALKRNVPVPTLVLSNPTAARRPKRRGRGFFPEADLTPPRRIG